MAVPTDRGVVMVEEAEVTEQAAPRTADAKRRLRGKPLGFAITLVVALAIFVGVGLLFHAQTYTSPAGTEVAKVVGTSTVDGVTLKHVTLAFNTYPDASGSVNGVPIHPGGNPAWPSYGPTNQYQVPAHSLVTVTIRQYDSGGSLNNPWFDKVRGTVGGTATINGKVVTSINPNNVGHTFTVRGTPGTDPGFFLNVPLAARPGGQPDRQREVRDRHVQLRLGKQGPLRLELRVPLRDVDCLLRRADERLRVHVGVRPCRLSSR